jgi:Spy/CpxP family protein refolding chaperone
MRSVSLSSNAEGRAMLIAAAVALGGLLVLSGTAVAQTPATAPHQHPAAAASAPAQDPELQKQIAELRAQVARLQAALDQQKQSPPAPATPSSMNPPPPTGRRMMGEMGGMSGSMPAGGGMQGEMGMKPGGMGAAQPKGMPGGGTSMMDMDMHKGEMGMPPDGMKMPDNMGEMGMGSMPGGTAAAAPPGAAAMPGMAVGGASTTSSAAAAPRMPRSISALPGVPGASHVYHVGSTGFFLDQPQLQLTTPQQAALNRIKERALLERANAERRIAQAEQELWTLTGADQPDATKVQAKLQEIEQHRTAQRIGFIRAVGEATKQLTPEQQNALLGAPSPK